MPDSDACGAESAPILVVLLVILLTGFSSPLEAHQAHVGLIFNQTIYGQFVYPEVELVARNHSIGLYRGGALRLQPWLAVSDDVNLGIDQSGRLVQVLEIPDVADPDSRRTRPARTLGIVLSSGEPIVDLFLVSPGTLIAIGRSGQAYSFSWDKWRTSGLRKILQRSGLIVGGLTCLSAVGTYLISCNLEVSPFSGPMVVQFLGMAASAAGINAFFAAERFENDNQNTDGLIADLGRLEGYRSSDAVRQDSGEIVDYLLRTEKGLVSLLEILLEKKLAIDNGQSFDRTCAHALLPRGIPPSHYEEKR